MTRKGYAALAALTLAPFLFAQKPLPEGKGRELTAKSCTGCHGTEYFVDQKLTRKEWEEVVDDMMRKGLDMKKADKEAVLDYLFEHFGEKK